MQTNDRIRDALDTLRDTDDLANDVAQRSETFERRLAQGDGIAKNTETDAPDPREAETWSFTFEHRDNRGRLWNGSFTNHILDFSERQKASQLAAAFSGGMPYESISPDMRELNKILAHLHYSLTKESRPQWAQDLRRLKDPSVVLALWEEVLGHEDTFLGISAEEGEA